MAIAFTDSPIATPGTTRTWTLTLTNKGPRAAVPVLTVERNVYMQPVELLSVTASGATCTTDFGALCRWNVPIPAGSSSQVKVNVAIGSPRVGPVSLEAGVTAANILPPFEDDRAIVETPLP